MRCRVKPLPLLNGGVALTTGVADFYGVTVTALSDQVEDHYDELADSGRRVLKGAELSLFKSTNPSLRGKKGGNLAVWPERAILNVGMLLRDSHVAQRVRSMLLDSWEI